MLTASHASASSGDKRHRAGLQASPAAGVPRLPACAHAGLLAEGASQPAEVLRRGGVPRQADPKPHLPESDAPRGTEVRLDEGEGEGAGAVECHSGTSWWVRGQRSECGRETKECGAASCVIDSCLHKQVHIPGLKLQMKPCPPDCPPPLSVKEHQRHEEEEEDGDQCQIRMRLF